MRVRLCVCESVCFSIVVISLLLQFSSYFCAKHQFYTHTLVCFFVCLMVLNNYRAKKHYCITTISPLSIKLGKNAQFLCFFFAVNIYALVCVCVSVCLSVCLFVYVYIKYLTNNFRLSGVERSSSSYTRHREACKYSHRFFAIRFKRV